VLTIFLTNGYEKRLRTTIDGITREIRTPGIYIANQRYVNRRIDLEFEGASQSGRFRIIVFKPIGKVALLQAVMRFNKTGCLSSIRSVVDVHDVERVLLESVDGSPIHFVADGEPLVNDRSLSISVMPEAFRVYRGGSR
jgi:diacylglycerol kinase family enzyme